MPTHLTIANLGCGHDAEDQDEQIMEILKYLTEWLVNHILYVDGQIPQN